MKTLPDLQQIEILILIVKHGSFRQAAKALNLSPPALTVAINHLEEKLGVRLAKSFNAQFVINRSG